MREATEKHKEFTDGIYENLPLISVLKLKNGQSYAFHIGGGVSQVLRISGLNPTSMSEGDFENLFRNLNSAFTAVPDLNASVQFCAVKRRRAKSDLGTDESIPKLIRSRAQNFNALIDADVLFEYDLFVSIYMHGQSVGVLPFLKTLYRKVMRKKSDPAAEGKIAFAGVKDKIFALQESVDNIKTVFERLGITADAVSDDQDYYNLWRFFTAPGDTMTDRKLGLGLDESFRQVLFSSSTVRTLKDHFILNNYYHKVFSLDRAPIRELNGGDIMSVFRVPCESMYSFTFMKLDRQTTNKRIGNSLWLRKHESSRGNDGNVKDEYATAAYERAQDEYRRIAEGGASGALVSASVVIRIEVDKANSEADRQNMEVRQYVRKIESALRIDGFDAFGASEWSVEQEGAWPVYCRLIPGFAELSSWWLKPILVSSEDAPYFMPVFTYDSGNEFHGTNGFTTSTGSLYAFDQESKALPAWNWLITGQSGSGKSVLINTIIAMEVANFYGRKRTNPGAYHPVICIMDVGGVANSFTKTVSLLGGQIVNLSSVKKPYINLLEINPMTSSPTPDKMKQVIDWLENTLGMERIRAQAAAIAFYHKSYEEGLMLENDANFAIAFEESFGKEMPEDGRQRLTLTIGEVEPNADQMNLITGVLEVMLSTSTKNFDVFESGEFRKDKLEKIIYQAYRQTSNRFPFLSDVKEIIASSPTADGAEMVERLSNWTRDSKYPMFDLPTDFDSSKFITLVDFKGVKADPKLQAIYNLLFSRLFSDKMFKMKNHRRLIIRDEAWEFMPNAASRQYFEADLRQARKHGYATITASQSVAEFMKPSREEGQAVLAQVTANIIGFEKEANVGIVADLLKLKPEIASLLTQMGRVKSGGVDQYTNFVLKLKDEYHVIQNRLHPFEANVFSSSDDDNAIIAFYKKNWDKRIASLEDIISHIAEGNHYGDKDLIKHLIDIGKMDMAKRLSSKRRF